MSVWDVAVGHRQALSKALGEDNIKDYWLDRRTAYHARALPEAMQHDKAILGKFATETVLNEAMYFNADVVFIVSGLNFHAAGLWLLERARIPTVVLFTESPYEDLYQQEWISNTPSLLAMTNDAASAKQYNWTYVPHAYSADTHTPGPVDTTLPQHDVVFVGSGWPERQQMLERVNWTGINLGLYGMWPGIAKTNPLFPAYRQGNVKNADTAQIYRNAKICLNIHRRSPVAASMGPRCYEIAGCGAFQLSDFRQDLPQVFGDSVPTFTSSVDLEQKIRFYLENESERQHLASKALTAVGSHTFDARTPLLLEVLSRASRAHAVKET
jgi:spore maturation protein CgeB